MTCIVGLIEDGRIWMGGDSCASNGTTRTLNTPKVFRRGPYLIGFAGSMREGHIMQYIVKLPDPPRTNLDKFMATDFTNAMRKGFKAGGQMGQVNQREEHVSNFMLAVRGRLYTSWQDFQIIGPRAGYDAIGSGADAALGAMYALNPYNVAPRQKILAALKASAQFNEKVAPPFHIRSIGVSE